MRIVYYHQHFSTPQGAAGVRSYFFAKELLARGHQVTMVCGSYSVGQTGLDTAFKHGRREGVVDGIRVVEFDLTYSNKDSFLLRSWKFAQFALRSVKLALVEDYDLVFATSTPLTAAIPGIVASALRNKKFVFEVRDLWPELPKAMGAITNPVILGLMRALEWTAYKTADRCVALSPGIKEGIVRSGKSSALVKMIPNGCDFSLFESHGEAWQNPNIDDSDFVAIFAGTHGDANGLDQVLDAANVLEQRGRKDITVVLVGDGKLKPALMQRAADERINNVIFLDPVSKKELARVFERANIGLQVLRNVPAFYFGTSPNKFFDYLSAALPVINNYPGWVAEMIDEYSCGIVVPPEDPARFADALEHAADNRAKLEIMGKNARNLAHERFDRNILANEFCDFIEEFLPEQV
jgi:glycosyltransferase involved in cell wall biosynthesis